jgi:hypothetical protein
MTQTTCDTHIIKTCRTAMGALAIGRLRILEGRIEKLSIGTLTVTI